MCDAKALRVLFKSPVTDDMIRFLTNTTLRVIPCAKETKSAYPSPPASPSRSSKRPLPSLMTFITRLVRYTNVYTSTLLTATCYLHKLQKILPKDAHGLPSTSHRIFLACLILSAKFHNDSSPQNRHWAEYTDGVFCLEDVNLMERQLLQLLNWDLRIEEEALYDSLEPLLEPIKHDLERSRKIMARNQYHQRNISVSSSTSTLVGTPSIQSLKSLPYLPKLPSLSRLSSWSSTSTPKTLSNKLTQMDASHVYSHNDYSTATLV
ncbi:LAME_0F19262g1_1 [Lachancea meyersii CBS 8951]|uniref:LAME_0F19262g1_1 n=1 Tax=Lachancea meyersii CBS 8951 TaxID=1266667 RepID=A0A1G4K1H1_9SACH|nr:LAME_0F19262g1_1 [Lachancea meyersii CBS 8951]